MVRMMIGVSLVAIVAVLLPAEAARAQQASGIAGVVKDASGAVLPGVTVEAASPALIEKVRTVVTDGEGQYKILDLRSGTYSVTFTLPGFSTFRREGIEMTSGFTATVNAEMKVGALEETVTVTGAAPLVDTQNVRKQNVVSAELLSTLPSGLRNEMALIAVTPGLVGYGMRTGEYQSAVGTGFHGQSYLQQKRTFDGMGIDNLMSSGVLQYTVNPDAVQEMVVQTNGITAESNANGVLTNMVPKEGSNAFRGTVDGLYTNDHMQSSHLTKALSDPPPQGRGVTGTDKTDYIYNSSMSLGGPIKQDKLWFFGSPRLTGFSVAVADSYWNKTQGTPFYTPDLSRPTHRYEWDLNLSGRVTWQASPKDKFAFFGDPQRYKIGRRANFTVAPEAGGAWYFWPSGLYQATWNRPATNRLLFEAAFGLTMQDWPFLRQEGVSVNDISITDISRNYTYGAAPTYNTTQDGKRWAQRGSMSYITGSHAFKAGFSIEEGMRHFHTTVDQNQRWQLFGTTPSRVVQLATPYDATERFKADLGIFAQDQWTIKRLTLNGGLRFEYFNGSVPAQDDPATPNGWVVARHFDAISNVPNWKDINPRFGAAYDLLGDGSTAIKFTIGRYDLKHAVDIQSAVNPINSSVNQINRVWNDNFYGPGDPRSGNYVPDCDLAQRGVSGECGAMSDPNFGGLKITTNWADDVLHGWGVRDYNWDLTTEVSHQFGPKVSATAGYYRNWYGNFTVTRNLAISPSDFDPYCITAPVDSRLPNGGGYQVCGLYDVSPAQFGKVNNLVTQSSNYGNMTKVNNFFQASINTRLGQGIVLGGGVDFGTSVTDACFVVDNPQQLKYCHLKVPYSGTAQVKLNGSYPLPKGFALSGIVQNVPGPQRTADYTATNAQIAPSLNRNLAACGTLTVCTATTAGQAVINGFTVGVIGPAGTIPLIQPFTVFEGRRTEVDLRLTKFMKMGGRMRLQANLDVYNVFNTLPILQEVTAYGSTWLKPSGGTTALGIQDPFQVQVSAQLTF